MARYRLAGSALPAAAALMTILVLAPLARIGVDPLHDGIMLKPALDVLSGQALFRETFTQYGALTTYLQALALAWCGATLLVLKYFTVAMYALSAFFLVASWKRLFALETRARSGALLVSFLFWIALAPCLSPAWILLPWSSVCALAFQSMGFYFLIRSLQEEHDAGWTAACGIVTAFTFWCRMPVGMTLALAALLSQIFTWRVSRSGRRALERVALYLGWCLGASAPFLIVQYDSGSFHDWFAQNFTWPRQWASVKRPMSLRSVVQIIFYTPLEYRKFDWLWLELLVLGMLATGRWVSRRSWQASLLFLAALGIFVAWLARLDCPPLSSLAGWAVVVPVTILVASFHRIYRTLRFGLREDLVILAAMGVGLASWSQYYPLPEERHLFWGLAPSIGIFLFWIRRAFRMDQGHASHRVALATLIVLLSPLIISQARAYWAKLHLPCQEVPGNPVLRGVCVEQVQAPEILPLSRAILSYVRDHPNVAIHTDGPDALYATFVHNLSNAGPFYIRWKGLPMGSAYETARAAFIARDHPLILVEKDGFGELVDPLLRAGYTRAPDGETPRHLLLLPPDR